MNECKFRGSLISRLLVHLISYFVLISINSEEELFPFHSLITEKSSCVYFLGSPVLYKPQFFAELSWNIPIFTELTWATDFLFGTFLLNFSLGPLKFIILTSSILKTSRHANEPSTRLHSRDWVVPMKITKRKGNGRIKQWAKRRMIFTLHFMVRSYSQPLTCVWNGGESWVKVEISCDEMRKSQSFSFRCFLVGLLSPGSLGWRIRLMKLNPDLDEWEECIYYGMRSLPVSLPEKSKLYFTLNLTFFINI